MDPHSIYSSITNSKFHEKLPDDDPAGSKHVATVHNEKNINAITCGDHSLSYVQHYVSQNLSHFYRTMPSSRMWRRVDLVN
jgi:predicted ATP-grasp superfamily ATP-dependent carboligase